MTGGGDLFSVRSGKSAAGRSEARCVSAAQRGRVWWCREPRVLGADTLRGRGNTLNGEPREHPAA